MIATEPLIIIHTEKVNPRRAADAHGRCSRVTAYPEIRNAPQDTAVAQA
jgi:hypothetical protein